MNGTEVFPTDYSRPMSALKLLSASLRNEFLELNSVAPPPSPPVWTCGHAPLKVVCSLADRSLRETSSDLLASPRDEALVTEISNRIFKMNYFTSKCRSSHH